MSPLLNPFTSRSLEFESFVWFVLLLPGNGGSFGCFGVDDGGKAGGWKVVLSGLKQFISNFFKMTGLT